MFIEANNKNGNRILINTDAIAYVDFDADFPDYKTGKLLNGVRIHFQASTGDEESHYLAFQDFAGKEAENLRAGLSKALGATRFS
ncbi:hypothetical protein [Nostoc sp. TCL240-02]|uniref:hypothetical protein n=1 Tax=Nostoc sp. TCL240-02 TaxID=2572090 RepID=UPI00157F90D1|nr:hypothetical protein [Nostoc sp. TCL240-02]QKQ75665.1 hypothetical protein FBB35_22320 [Nostoc sp. TCL240-02]